MKSKLVEQFLEVVKNHGPKTAVVDYPDGKTQRETSFNALMKRARQVTAYIKRQGIEPQSFITLELMTGPDFLAAEMGVWMSRCVVVPMGPNYPNERKQYIRHH